MAETISDFDSIDVSSFEVSPGDSATPTVIVVVGKGHPRPVALSLTAEALFSLTSAAFAACEKVDRPRIIAAMGRIASAYGSTADRQVGAGGEIGVSLETRSPMSDDRAKATVFGSDLLSIFGTDLPAVLDGIAEFQKLCRTRGISDAVSASLMEFMISSGVMDPLQKRAAGASVGGSSADEDPEE
jgi:hypothetical protein